MDPGRGEMTLISTQGTRVHCCGFYIEQATLSLSSFSRQSSPLLAGMEVYLLLEITGAVRFPGIIAELKVIPTYTTLGLSMRLPLSTPASMVPISGL